MGEWDAFLFYDVLQGGQLLDVAQVRRHRRRHHLSGVIEDSLLPLENRFECSPVLLGDLTDHLP
ncbi:hypothetical protein A5676_13000 [Mycobacterium malmoense]|nr:hypothetical protein A5676_13000 [Mycobacterium malmoense]